MLAYRALRELPEAIDEQTAKRNVVDAVKRTGLRNTAAVSRQAYIHPEVLQALTAGSKPWTSTTSVRRRRGRQLLRETRGGRRRVTEQMPVIRDHATNCPVSGVARRWFEPSESINQMS